MSNTDVVIVLTALGILVALAGVFLGIPAWRISKHAVRVQQAADDQVEFNRRLVVALTGSEAPEPPSRAHPSVVDSLADIRESMTEMAVTQSVLAHHLSVPHGGPIPAHLRARLG